jgi:Cytochrome P450
LLETTTTTTTPQLLDSEEKFRERTSTWLKGMWTPQDSPEFQATLEAKDYLVQVMETQVDRLLQAGHSDGSTLGGLVYATTTTTTTMPQDTANNDNNNDDDNDNDNDNDDNNTGDPERTLTRQQVIDNALLLILAGTETTSSTIANALLLMGLHPHVWEKVVQEQRHIVTEHGETLTPALVLPDQEKAPYLDAVLQETMRIMPITLVSRRVTTDTIVVDEMQIPKGVGVSYNVYLTHQQDDKLEKDGMDLLAGFKPERWLDPATRPVKPDYIPFGTGPRYCPGSLLAMTEQKTFLSLLARALPQYQLEMDVDPSIPIDDQIHWNERSAVATPQDGVPIRINHQVQYEYNS